MKTSVFNTIVFIIAFIVGYLIFEFALPKYIKDGGPLVIVLIALIVMLLGVVLERFFSLKKANGKEE